MLSQPVGSMNAACWRAVLLDAVDGAACSTWLRRALALALLFLWRMPESPAFLAERRAPGARVRASLAHARARGVATTLLACSPVSCP